jgi:hypothetical protein
VYSGGSNPLGATTFMFRKNKCYDGGNQHNFQPRYDEVPNSAGVKIQNAPSVSSLRSVMYYQVYVKDICVWCGKEVKK